MIPSIFDLFSQPFSFTTDNYQSKRGTFFGTIISFAVFFVTISYFIYILKLYASNQIDPIFRSQSVISHDLIETQLNNDLVGFKFQIDTTINLSENKTYLVYLAFYQYSSPTINLFVPLNVIDCTNQELQGFKCLDFTSVQNNTLFLNTNQNAYSNVQIRTYGCKDLDALKTFVPDNCADQTEIDQVINGINSILQLKLYTSQYNSVSQTTEVNYRNAYIYTIANQQIFTQIKTQKQITSVKQGLIVQSEQQFSSPIQYTQQDQGFDRNYTLQNVQAGSYSTVLLLMDEIVQQIQIQYPSLPQILAMVSGVFTLLMFVGIIGRKLSQYSIQEDFFLLFLKNIYQDNYLQVLKKNNLNSQKEEQEQVNTEQLKFKTKLDDDDDISEVKNEKQKESLKSTLSPPIFYNKRKISIDKFENNINQVQSTENKSVTPISSKFMFNSKSTQCVNLENIETISQNINLESICQEKDENTSPLKINKKLKQLKLQNSYQERNQTKYASQIIQKQQQFNLKNDQLLINLNEIITTDKEKDHLAIMNNFKVIQDLNLSHSAFQNIKKIKQNLFFILSFLNILACVFKGNKLKKKGASNLKKLSTRLEMT